MSEARKLCAAILSVVLTAMGYAALGGVADSPQIDMPAVPASQPADRPLPINLPTALRLGNVNAVDIAAASERIQVAAAVLQRARVLWLPSVTVGGDYFYHAGSVQDVSNVIFNDLHSGFMLGAGSGIGNSAVLTVTDAIFAPLVAKQRVKASEADRLAASNNTLVAVSDAYFTVQQARGELAGAMETLRRTEELLRRTRSLAPEIVAELELYRAEAEMANRERMQLLAREKWRVASAELLRVLCMDPSAQVEPVEPPQLRIELIDLKRPVDDLIAVGLTHRPELAAQKFQIQAALASIKQERWRPLLPNIIFRGASTNPGGTLAGGAYFPAPNNQNIMAGRGDFDIQVLWQLDNLGFGNRATIHQREAEKRLAVIALTRLEYEVAGEISQAYSQAQFAGQRIAAMEKGVQAAALSAEKNLEALRKTKGVGNQLVTIVRPQEVVAAIQTLAQAYSDYFAAVADANRAQFRLYRAIGQPANCVLQDRQNTVAGALSLSPPAPANPTPTLERDLPPPRPQLGFAPD